MQQFPNTMTRRCSFFTASHTDVGVEPRTFCCFPYVLSCYQHKVLINPTHHQIINIVFNCCRFAVRRPSQHAFGTGASNGVPHHGVPPLRLQGGSERHPQPTRAPRADGERAVQLPEGMRSRRTRAGRLATGGSLTPSLVFSVSEGPRRC